MKSVVKHFFLVQFFLFFVCSCSDRKSEQKCHDDILKDLNTNIGDPDTALVVFFWNETMTHELLYSVVEYTRLETEFDKFNILMYKLYGTCSNYDKKIKQIDSLRKEFRNSNLKYIIGELEKNGGSFNDNTLEGYYFLQTKDQDSIYDFLISTYGIYKE